MDATTYSGTNVAQNITNQAGFKPDLVWMKQRNGTAWHALFDSVRGVTKGLASNDSGAEVTSSAGQDFTSFNSNGFGVGVVNNWNSTNVGGGSIVGWQWQAGQGTTSSNTNGSITSTVSVNTTAGFSIVTYTGTGSNATVGHGLGVAPSFIAFKIRNNTYSWRNYHVSTGNAGYVYFNSSDGYTASSTTFNNTSPTSSVFSVGTEANTNASGGTFVAYCWAEIAGFSKFGSYTGNGSTDGPFVYTGFRPKFLLFKQSSASGEYWHLMDTSRSPYNGVDLDLYPNLSNAEATYSPPALDLLSNGFKFRTSNSAWNGSGATYIYAAFAENPTKFANAR